ncbi:serine protein kinase RIO [archaeon]|jgi:RIO kinase 1|nr:serine protein kinase RIO [archaeon]MBT3451098.1 serine protein kinase RIO [archaeon]MBT6868658.1 serine protein kinase RIO [archaeon]MBT7193375.1 serine protein kinase RIO [archaeon]MBT7381455.1 serine protein kinase RIO [archaeon]
MVTLTYQERFRTEKGVFDEFTKRNLFGLESRGVFDELLGPVFVGKESNVFLARKGDDKIIVKIYRVQNCDFKKMYEYIRQDSRFENLKRRRREIIFGWTQREYKNLLKSDGGGVSVPKAYACKFNILVEEMIGDGSPAPQLKDQIPQNPEKFFELLLKEIEKLYKTGLVHGDLSAFNVLNHNEKPYLIDFSQSTLIKSSNANLLLERDLYNICKFFKKLGIKLDQEKIMQKILSQQKV